jgi:ribonuclease VapC
MQRIAEAPIRLMSSAHAVEAWIVADQHANPAKGPALDALLETLGIDIVPVTVQHARLARTAYHTYGRGRHPVGLNFDDCFAYALAKATDLPRLFKAAGHRYARPSRPSASRLSLGIDQLWYDRNNIQGLSLWPHTVWQAPIIAA